MDHYSILDESRRDSTPGLVPAARAGDESRTSTAGSSSSSATALRFPGEDGGKSLAEMAQRDLNVALQLLAERAQYITGASGSAIALREGEELICRARAGPSAPEVGAQLQVSSGLTGESVRTREILRCNDASTDPRVNRESCRALGIASVMVMPLLHEQEITGVFELLSDRTHAFEERDIVALQRLGEMIATAIDHADAVKRGIQEVSTPPAGEHENPAPEPAAPPEVTVPPIAPVARDTAPSTLTNTKAHSSPSVPAPVFQQAPAEPARPKLSNVRMCQACGFPVSGSRTLCLDCEAAQSSQPQASGPAPAFLAEIENAQQKNWLREHIYTIGIVLMALLTGLLLLWLHPH
jgi:putative methionine-R-sulfoxide reductase with GAF domain